LEVLHGHKRVYEEIVVCFGNFDGVHLGHQALIGDMTKYCDRNNFKSMVYTFNNHPMEIIAPARHFRYLQNINQKTSALEATKIDYLCLSDFDLQTMNCSASAFLQDLEFYFKIRAIFVGFNYKFGKNGFGNISFLKNYGLKHNIDIFIEKPFEIAEKTVSSSRIRNLVHEGKIEEANNLLSRPFSIIGNVVEGFKLGRTLGFPTANIKLNEKYVIPKGGVYHTQVIVDGRKYKAVTNVGNNPTFEDRYFSIETHILDFHDLIYKKNIEIQFIKFLRDERKFETKELLIEQIQNDINQVLKN